MTWNGGIRSKANRAKKSESDRRQLNEMEKERKYLEKLHMYFTPSSLSLQTTRESVRDKQRSFAIERGQRRPMNREAIAGSRAITS